MDGQNLGDEKQPEKILKRDISSPLFVNRLPECLIVAIGKFLNIEDSAVAAGTCRALNESHKTILQLSRVFNNNFGYDTYTSLFSSEPVLSNLREINIRDPVGYLIADAKNFFMCVPKLSILRGIRIHADSLCKLGFALPNLHEIQSVSYRSDDDNMFSEALKLMRNLRKMWIVVESWGTNEFPMATIVELPILDDLEYLSISGNYIASSALRKLFASSHSNLTTVELKTSALEIIGQNNCSVDVPNATSLTSLWIPLHVAFDVGEILAAGFAKLEEISVNQSIMFRRNENAIYPLSDMFVPGKLCGMHVGCIDPYRNLRKLCLNCNLDEKTAVRLAIHKFPCLTEVELADILELSVHVARKMFQRFEAVTSLSIQLPADLVPSTIGDTALMPKLTSLRIRFSANGSCEELVSLENRFRMLTSLDIGTCVSTDTSRTVKSSSRFILDVKNFSKLISMNLPCLTDLQLKIGSFKCSSNFKFVRENFTNLQSVRVNFASKSEHARMNFVRFLRELPNLSLFESGTDLLKSIPMDIRHKFRVSENLADPKIQTVYKYDVDHPHDKGISNSDDEEFSDEDDFGEYLEFENFAFNPDYDDYLDDINEFGDFDMYDENVDWDDLYHTHEDDIYM
eukprot:464245_1